MSGSRIRPRSSRSVRPTGGGTAAPGGRGRRPSLLSARSVVGQMFLLQVVIVLLLAVGAVALLVMTTQRDSARDAGHRSVAVAQGFASSPGLAAALTSGDPTATLQPRVVEAQKQAHVDFVGVLNRDGVYEALASPVNRPGYRSNTDFRPLLAGRTVMEEATGGLGPQIRAYVPVRDADGRVVGAVGAGVTLEHVGERVTEQLPAVLGATAAAVAVTTGTAALLSRRLWRQTRGLGPAEITRMYDHHDAVLHSVREGVVIVGEDGRLLLANDEAWRLLELPADAQGRPVADLGLDPRITGLLTSGRTVTDQVYLVGDRLLAVNVRPTDARGGPAGSAVTLRDTTELRALAGRAEAALDRLTLLYEAGTRIGTTLDVTRTAQDLTDVAVPRFADIAAVMLLEPVFKGEEPPDARTVMRRTAVSGTDSSWPLYPVGERLRLGPDTPMTVNLAHGNAVLVSDLTSEHDWRARSPERAQGILDHGIGSLITVPLRARGVVLGLADFWRYRGTEPFQKDDLSFAEELAARAAVAIDNARRYTREHTMAVTLQRSLLPRAVPEQSALDVAHRYLPSHAGVCGDWFDVIPLPGTRVALVVGDVVGRGLHASATMGRLRTAVHNFSALDLAPDELLAHLDELVARTDTEERADEAEEAEAGITGATCLYAVYDPVSGVCTMARAGHPGPAVVTPDGAVTFPDVPLSPPLGLGGGAPFETATIRLPEGSRLALFTDGLIEEHRHDPDTGLSLLRRALARTGPDPDETCRTVIEDLLPDRPADDVVLLVARTRITDPGQVAEWDVPSDPAAVSRLRYEVSRRLDSWGLPLLSFSTELMVSELVTNALRHGSQPVRLRLLLDSSLICEVADGSSTSPHLRRARLTDEGGRGLFLVARFARRWGTRYTSRGKVIWAEQPLDQPAEGPETDTADALLAQWEA
ncbi:SpoIIE family protein phosphatase [Streptomyces thermodiastaticus]